MENKNEYKNLLVSSAPHIVTSIDTQKTMLLVLLALVPSFCVSIYVFGFSAILLTAVCVIASVFFEWAWNKLMKKEQTVGDLSAVLTGVLIAFNCPSELPLWIAVIGCFVAIIVVKQLYGGIGKNLVNPAITARIVLFISFATQMTTWPLPLQDQAADVTTGATPLGLLAEGGESLPSNLDLFLGFVGGSMGEVSALALLIGGAFLVWKKIISPIIPACFIGTVFLFALVYYAAAGVPEIATGYGVFDMALFHVLAGGVMLGAIFMATDYVTSPMLPLGKVIMGVGCGVITMLIRLFGAYPEGVSFSILIMNILVPLIDNFALKMEIKKQAKGGAK
ncbi:MAG: RnfABCDGE type electron transport complex subunit D [Clostridia bacterium]|nr:RnfABCDGE type electron transport complex subunit D [Clostridia bacterium]